MSSHFDDEQHDGKCGHCMSDVPLNAIVCARCGARWGTASGKTKRLIYDESRAKFIVCSMVCLAIAVFFATTALNESPWVLAAMILAVIPGAPAIGIAIGSLITMNRARHVEVTWWREL